jgi:regulator of sigma E protease
MSELKQVHNRYFRVVLFVVFFVLIVFLIVRHISVFGNILLVMLGFGAVVLIHEFGHFIVAKLSNIKVEAFSIFMPPILFGIKRTEDGYRFRFLPEIFPKQGDQSGEGAMNFTIGKKGLEGETEYRIGLIPFGGFVKMLGQDDIGPIKNNDDPRSYANKPVYIRAATIAAGVVFNVISAVIIFMITFLIGISLQPAIIGGVQPDSPAARAGLKAGDEVIAIAGDREDLDFSNIRIAAALSGKDEAVPMTVKHPDGSEQNYSLVAELLPGEQMKLFGIELPQSLAIAKLSKADANDLYSSTGLLPGDRITSVNGRDVRGYWELEQIIQKTFLPEVTLSAERVVGKDKTSVIEAKIPLYLNVIQDNNAELDLDLSHIYSMVPRLRVLEAYVVPDAMAGEGENRGFVGKLLSVLRTIRVKIFSYFAGKKQTINQPESPLHGGDIILAVGDMNDPTYRELQETVTKYKDKEMPVKVLRTDPNGTERELTITVTPKQPKGSKKVYMGIAPALDAQHAVIAKTIDIPQYSLNLNIPRGARITAIDGEPVRSFYDVIREIKRYPSQRITLDWRLNEETAGSVALNVRTDDELVDVRSAQVESLPFAILKKTYKASGPINAIVMGFRRTVMFIAQTYVTLKRLLSGLVSPKNLMGPVGIIKASYDIVSEQPIVYYIYFLGLISAVIAVFNFLPLPPLDGGLVVLLLIEKFKGSALSERVQTVIAYTGWVLILALFLYVTFNDIVRSFFSPALGS